MNVALTAIKYWRPPLRSRSVGLQHVRGHETVLLVLFHIVGMVHAEGVSHALPLRRATRDRAVAYRIVTRQQSRWTPT